jgi:prepilin-type N-terminal cleavage/methylation domain-containing protein
MKLTNQKGFTLVETIVASVVSLVVGGAMFSLLFMYSNRSNESISSFLLQQQYENVSQQIGRDVRRASLVLKEGETPSQHGSGFDTVTTIVLWNATGAIFAKYKIDGTTLNEGVDEKPYQVGSGSVKINGYSYFVISPQRKNVNINLSLSKTNRGTLVSSLPRMDILLCRN